MSLRTNMHQLQTQAQQLTMQRDSLLRLLVQVVIEHGGDTGELIVSHEEANKIDMRCYVIDTVPTADGRMAIRYRNTVLNPTIDAAPRGEPEPEAHSGLALVAPVVEEEPEETAPPCRCTHEKEEHVGGIGSCRRGDCFCEGYDPVGGAA